jgi:hypothetical protein
MCQLYDGAVSYFLENLFNFEKIIIEILNPNTNTQSGAWVLSCEGAAAIVTLGDYYYIRVVDIGVCFCFLFIFSLPSFF